MSERSGTASAASSAHGDTPKRAATIAELVARVHAKLGHAAPLSLTDHLKAAKALCGVRDRLATGEELDAKARMLLLCTGIAVYRRWSVGDADGPSADGTSSAADEAAQRKENEEAKELIGGTATRIFALLCASERLRKRTSADERVGVVEAARATVAADNQSSVWARMAPSRKRARSDDDVDGEGEGDGDEGPSWEEVMQTTTGEIARHALVLGMECLEEAAFEALDDLARLFLRSAGTDMSDTLLMPNGDENIVSLAIARPMAERTEAERAKRLAALAMAAESEAGQSVRPFLVCAPPFPVRAPSHPRTSFAGCARSVPLVFAPALTRGRAQNAAAHARVEHAGGR